MKVENKVPAIRFKGFSGEWENKLLGELFRFQYGQYNINPSDGGIYPVYGANGVIGGFSQFNAEDSIVIGHMGENAGSILWGSGKHFVTYNGTITTPKNSSVISIFGYYILKKLNIKKKCGGSGQPFLSYETLQKLDSKIPRLTPEQTKIGNYFQQLDTLIAQHQQKHDKLLNLKKALLEKMFPKPGATEPEIRFKNFSGEWEEKALGEFSEVTTGKLDANAMKVDGEYDFYTSGIKKYKIDVPAFEGPAITIAGNGATVGYMYLADGKFNAYQRTYVLTNFIADRYFLYFQIGKVLPLKISQEARTGNIPYIVLDMLTDLEILLPKKKEQAKIGNLFKQLDTLISQHQAQLKKLNNIKQACLEKMFV